MNYFAQIENALNEIDKIEARCSILLNLSRIKTDLFLIYRSL